MECVELQSLPSQPIDVCDVNARLHDLHGDTYVTSLNLTRA